MQVPSKKKKKKKIVSDLHLRSDQCYGMILFGYLYEQIYHLSGANLHANRYNQLRFMSILSMKTRTQSGIDRSEMKSNEKKYFFFSNTEGISIFYSPPHDSGGVLWFHVDRPCVRTF